MTRVSDSMGGRVAGLTILGLLVLLGGLWVGILFYAGDEAPRNARVEGVSIAGLEPEAAEEKLRGTLESRTSEPIGMSYGDGRSVAVDPREAGLSIDYAASVRAAGGGSGFGPTRLWEVLTGGGDHHVEVSVDQSKMQSTLDELGSGLQNRPLEGSISFDGGKAVAVQGQPGEVVDRSKAQEILEQRFLHGGSQKLPTLTRQPEISEEIVREAMAEFAEPAMSGPVTLELGGQRVVAPPKLFSAGLSMVAEEGELEPRVDGELMLEALQPVMRTIGREPEDARIVVRQGKPRVVPAKVGAEIDPQDLEDRFAEVAVLEGDERRLELEGQATQPDFTTADAKKLGVTEQVSTATTNFPYAEYRNVNLTRAAELVDGTLLLPGETFSLNETVGERTKENGFTEGYIISDGIFKKDLGGGVSQIATTTFNAMYFAGLEDVEHKPHSVYIDRYPVGREATVAWPSIDLRFTNSTPYGVLIKASVRKSTPSQEGAATVTMYSTKHWKITSRNGPRTDYTSPKVRYLQDPACEEAVGTQGFSINVFRTFADLETGEKLRTEKFSTTYIPGDTVRCGPPPKPEPEPKPKPKPNRGND